MTCEKHENWHAVCHKCAHQELLDAQEGFADYKYRSEVLEKERDEARASIERMSALHTELHASAMEWQAEVARLKAERDHLEVLWKAEMEHANKWAARARKAESDFSYMNRIRDHLQGQVLELQRDRETACENTPTKGCECPGCCTARERAERGEA